MNIKKANKQFNKLSSFYQSVAADGKINQIELDLLKSYVLSFYETLHEPAANIEENNASKTNGIAKPAEEIKQFIAPQISIPVDKVTPEVKASPVQEPSFAKSEITQTAVKQRPSKEIEALFEIETGTDISDKLATSAIKDIAKAMSINEKIFTVKELFSGSQESFVKAMTDLNSFKSYEEAKDYLIENVVKENNWEEEQNLKKVKTFLKLVHRKYI